MKLIRFGAPARERPGLILPDGRRIDASGFAGESADYDEAFFGWDGLERLARWVVQAGPTAPVVPRSEEHTSELQSRPHLVCRLLLEKKKTFNLGYSRRTMAYRWVGAGFSSSWARSGLSGVVRASGWGGKRRSRRAHWLAFGGVRDGF